MQISEHVYAKKMQFQAKTPAGVMERTVYVYVVSGDEASCLIDTGVAPSADDVLAFIAEAGKTPEDISGILLSHAHVDHTGALAELKRRLGCTAAASAESARWIEDIDAQFKERPVPGFKNFLQESATVERILADGDTIELGNSTLIVHAAPGHEKGQLAFFHLQDGVLFTADSIPIPGEIPIYDDVAAQVNTLHRLSKVEGMKVLLLSWGETHRGKAEIQSVFRDALAYVKRVHELTQQGLAQYGEENAEEVARYIHTALGLPPSTFTILFTNTIHAHIRERNLDINV